MEKKILFTSYNLLHCEAKIVFQMLSKVLCDEQHLDKRGERPAASRALSDGTLAPSFVAEWAAAIQLYTISKGVLDIPEGDHQKVDKEEI